MDTATAAPSRLRVAKLLMVTRAHNNKFYDMEEEPAVPRFSRAPRGFGSP